MEKFGFTLWEERDLAEVGGTARLWKHGKTGAQLLSIINSDENKCFGATFFTPPVNSTGVAHILEHSVLCGSDRFPVKEPFVELLKGSLQTFLNAFTFPDKTCYPVASANLQDFYNLVDVYLDAVFHPLLSEDIFRQEGWHVDAETADGPWTFKGVVYNEMKGVYSSPDSILAEKSQQAIFPDNLYSLDSGGNPQCIPDLTYAAFKDFHSRYYQPGNARFFFWGDDPEDERLRIIARTIAGYGSAGELPKVDLQKKFSSPRELEVPYASADGEERAMFTVNWLLCERGNLEEALKLEMLEHILEGLPGSPLRRALMESGLGEDTTGCGLETDLRQMYYSTGLKGLDPVNAGKGEELVISTLRNLAEKGIDKNAVEAAINSVEFAYRENNSGRLPRGLAAMILSLSTWLYGGDPLAPLAWEEPLEKIKKAVANGENVFEETIKKYFLDNAHKVRVTLLPDDRLGASVAREEAERLNAIQEASSAQTRQEIVAETARLRENQLKPDTPENLATIPALKISDLPKKNAIIPIQVDKGDATFISHDLQTNGIAYVNMLLPIPSLPERLVPYLPLFSRALTEWGTSREDYSQLGMRIAARLGGLGASPLVGLKLADRAPFAFLNLGAKAVYANLPDMFDLCSEILLDPQTNAEIIIQRIGQMILEDKARLEYSLQAAGHMAVGTRLRARYSVDGALDEKMRGVSQLWFLRDLVGRLEKDPASVLADFEELRDILINRDNIIFNCVAERSVLQNLRSMTEKLAASLPKKPFPAGAPIAGYTPMNDLPRGEAFITPGQVNYVGKAANLYDLGYKYSGSANVIIRWLRMGKLWEEVRVAGGAYGVFCSLDRIGGTMLCSSYRDPNVDKTLSAYDGLVDYLRNFKPTAAQLDQAIIGAVGDVDAYLLPDAKGAFSLGLWLSGQTEEGRQQMRDEMLATTTADFNNFADVLAAASQAGTVCVLGGTGAEAAATEHGWVKHQLP